MQTNLISNLSRRTACAALLCAGLLTSLTGCSGISLFSSSPKVNREEELVKTLNEERKRAQYYQGQYEQALARLDGRIEQKDNVVTIGSSRDSKAFTSPKSSTEFISSSSPAPSSKTLSRLAGSLPGLRLGPDRSWAKLDADLLFDGGSQDLSQGAEALLSDLAKTLTQDSAENVRVLVVGYSDTHRPGETGGEAATWNVAAQRAVEVVRRLGQAGVSADRLSAMSLGAQNPVAGSGTAAARAQNRRVEIYLMENDAAFAPDWTAALKSDRR